MYEIVAAEGWDIAICREEIICRINSQELEILKKIGAIQQKIWGLDCLLFPEDAYPCLLRFFSSLGKEAEERFERWWRRADPQMSPHGIVRVFMLREI
jgi:hypothetical protein